MKTQETIQKEEITDLTWNDMIQETVKPGDFSISLINGLVMLEGTVDSLSKKALAEQVVSNITGMPSIVNTMEMKLPRVDRKMDEELTDRILDAIIREFNTQEESFCMKIENEWITIEGHVKNMKGETVPVKGKLCKLEQKRAQHNLAIANKQELAYWEIFSS